MKDYKTFGRGGGKHGKCHSLYLIKSRDGSANLAGSSGPKIRWISRDGKRGRGGGPGEG